MSLTVKELKEFLKGFNDEVIVVNQEGRSFPHLSNLEDGSLLISSEKPIGYCKRTGGYVFPTSVEDYVGVVPELDENVDLGEILLPDLEKEEFPNKFGRAVEIKSRYKEPFLLLIEELGEIIPQEVWEKLYLMDVTDCI